MLCDRHVMPEESCTRNFVKRRYIIQSLLRFCACHFRFHLQQSRGFNFFTIFNINFVFALLLPPSRFLFLHSALALHCWNWTIAKSSLLERTLITFSYLSRFTRGNVDDRALYYADQVSIRVEWVGRVKRHVKVQFCILFWSNFNRNNDINRLNLSLTKFKLLKNIVHLYL